MNKNETTLLRKTKTWTTVNIVILLLGAVMSTFSVVSLLGMKASGYAAFKDLPGGNELVAALEKAASPISITISFMIIALYIALVVWFFKANAGMKKNIVPEKTPYYVNIGLFVLGQIYSLISGGTQGAKGGAIFAVVLAVVFLAIRLMPLVYLRQIATRPGEQVQEVE